MLRPAFDKLVKLNWKFGLILILLFGIPRFLLVLNANVSGQFNLVSIVFVLMWLAPWILLTKTGRREVGIRKPAEWAWMIPAFVLGAGFCVLIYFLGRWLFFDTQSNWFIYLSKPYQMGGGESVPQELFFRFIVFALIGMTFSPFGEEFLYRGLIHRCFVSRLGEHGASVVDSAAFSLTHLAHFGIVYIGGSWHLSWLPGLIWLILIFISGRLFYTMKKKTGSVFGAVASHAGFNAAMSYIMVYFVVN